MNPGWYINNFEFLWKRVRSKSTKCCPAEARVFQFAITSKVSIKPLSALSVTFNPLHAILGRFVEVLQSDLHKHFRFDLQFQMWNPFINAYFILLAWFFVSMCFFFFCLQCVSLPIFHTIEVPRWQFTFYTYLLVKLFLYLSIGIYICRKNRGAFGISLSL